MLASLPEFPSDAQKNTYSFRYSWVLICKVNVLSCFLYVRTPVDGLNSTVTMSPAANLSEEVIFALYLGFS